MAQSSGPKTNQTFTDAEWRRGIGAEPSIQGDLDGTSYGIQLATNSDVASIGSATQESTAVVGGFPHWIPAGQPEGITVPAATTSARTDLIVLRYDPTWGTTDPGPVRLARIAGTEGAGVPAYDAAPPGVEDFPLWAVTRQPGQALSQATTRWLGVRSGPNLYVRTSSLADLPLSAPLGTRVRLGSGSNSQDFLRVLDDQANPVWQLAGPRVHAQTYAIAVNGATGSTAITWPLFGGDLTKLAVHASLKYQGVIGDVGVNVLPWKITGGGCELVIFDVNGAVKTTGVYDVMVTVTQGT